MKTNSTQREILLVTNNSFAQREWCKREKDPKSDFNPYEQMEEICANGLIYEILPELFITPGNQKLFLWQMHSGFSFLQLEYGEYPFSLDKSASIDPHNSLSLMCHN